MNQNEPQREKDWKNKTASVNRGTVSRSLTYMYLESQQRWERSGYIKMLEEIMTENIPNLMKSLNWQTQAEITCKNTHTCKHTHPK